MKPIKLYRVEKVYSGRTQNCYCGCSGTYWYPDAATDCPPDERSSARVKRIVNKLNKNLDSVVSGGDIFILTIGRHDWTVYMKPYTNLDMLEDKSEEKSCTLN